MSNLNDFNKEKQSFGSYRQPTAKIYKAVHSVENKPTILLHICCIGCGAYVTQLLRHEYDVFLYYYNPNIFPKEEYQKRLDDISRIARELNLDVSVPQYDHDLWLEKVKGLEDEPEKGGRCLVCYKDRLEDTAKEAKRRGIDYFTTTLTVSPHKLSNAIFEIGAELEKDLEVNFLARDFKKQGGFNKAAEFSRNLNLYRQDYCGCEFSMRK